VKIKLLKSGSNMHLAGGAGATGAGGAGKLDPVHLVGFSNNLLASWCRSTFKLDWSTWGRRR